MTDYQAFGLRVRSTLDLPCVRAMTPAPADVRLTLSTRARAPSAATAIAKPRARHWFFHDTLSDGTTYLRWTGLSEFLISPDGRRISYHPLEHATAESLGVYLLGQVLSFSLVAFGHEPLHGTVVAIDGRAVALVGDCGYGKSTLGAAMLARGCPIVTDDVVALAERGGGWSVHPGIPRIKLFPSVARRLLGQDADGTRMNTRTAKLVIPLSPAQTMPRLVPLAAVYVLSPPKARTREVQIEPMAGREAFLEVIRGAFNLLVVSRDRLANQFAFATRLATDVPIRRARYPRTFAALPAVCDAIATDLNR